ncbi:MAG: alpha-2-macroglobulin [Betaproteobacteria bacterium]|nr:alpha-2-macroglobulin [Betaproteobacteria bacterium]
MRCLIPFLSLWPVLALAADIESFSPQGEVKEVRQIKVRFDADMAPLGDPALADPMIAECPAPGSGRWVDGRNWVYDLRRDPPGGVRCRFSTRPGLTALDGTPVKAAAYSFHTGGPAIVAALPGEGQTVQEDQVFLLGLDAPVREASLKGRLWCVAEGVAERIPVQFVLGKPRRKVLEASAGFFQDYFSTLGARAPIQAPAGAALTRAQILKFASEPNAPILVVQCGRRAPAGARLGLLWEQGIESVAGVAVSAAQTLQFRTRASFSARLRCDKLNPRAGCLPLLPVTLNFSAPIPLKAAQQIVLSGNERVWKPKLNGQDVKGGVVDSLEFPGPFPERANLILTLPADLRDEAGRALVNAKRFPMAVKFDLMPPLAKFAAGFGLYELNASPALPLTLRYTAPLTQGHALLSAKHLVTQNPREIFDWMRRIKRLEQDEYDDKGALIRQGAESPLFEARHKIENIALPKPLPERETEVIGIPLQGAGFHIVEVSSPTLGAALLDKPSPYHVRATALVTNMAVHFKRGAETSLVWVTSLDGAKPVAEAEVAVRDCGGAIHVQGKTDAQGLWRIHRPLPEQDKLPGCLDDWNKEFFVTASKGEDFSFTLSGWNEGISPWRFNLFTDDWRGPWLAHAVLDRGLYRAGEEAGIKLLVRRKRANGFAFVEKERLGRQVILRHRGSDDEIKLPVSWDGQGIAEIAYSLPKEIKQGTWDIVVTHTLKGGKETQELTAGSLRVAAFRLPAMKARLSGPALAVNPRALHLDMQVSYLAGGAASRLGVTLRGQLHPLEVSFPEYEDASIANGRVKPGRPHDAWQIDRYDVEEEEGAPVDGNVTPLKTQRLTLDGGGAGRAGWDELPPLDTPRLLRAEAEYRDANGEVKSAAARVPLYPARVLAGVQPDSWVQSKDSQRFRLLALDPAGKPMAGVAMKARFFKRDWYSYRKRVIGGFYAYEHSEEIKPLGDACAGRTDARGVYFCEARAPAGGDLILEAEARDADGNASYAQQQVWVPEGDGWADASDNDRMDLIPEKRRLEIGETARFHLRMPFESASVLVSVEREGVLDAWVTQVRRDKPVIEVPIKPEYGPNVFISALAVRGRVAGVQPTAMVDLGKPAFRMGMSEIQVGWSGYALEVKLQADKTRYQTREKARVRVQVRRPDGSTPKNGEIALAAVDEGLLELAPNASWKLLDAMMQRRGIQVTTSTAQMQVVGKRHYGRKAVPAGGGGGRSSARELFDTRVFWQARVKLDEKGEAEVEIPLNDSLTTFRVVAVANAGAGRFGTGQTALPVTQDLQLLSGAAPLVREGDRLKVYFTLRNVSEREMTVDLSARHSGDGGKAWMELPAASETLAPGQGREIALPVDAPTGARLTWEVSAQERGGAAKDRLRIHQTVQEAVPVRTFQATLAQVDAPLAVPVERPAAALPGRGGIAVRFQAKLAGDLAGVREYMEGYPFTCLEQQTSQAVALSDAARWKSLVARLPAYLDGDGLAKYWPAMKDGSDTLTAYLLSLSSEAGLALPDELRQRMSEGLKAFVEGRLRRDAPLATADLAVRKLAAIDALTRTPEGKAEAAWLDSFSLTPNLWPTSAVLDWIGILQRSPHLAGRDARLAEARQILRARLDLSGTALGFSSERSDAWWWLMVNGDVNANRLILSAFEGGDWAAADLGRLMRGSLARQQRGHWNTTVANAWGVLATRRFSERLETQTVGGVTRAGLGGEAVTRDWNAGPASGSQPGGLKPAPQGLLPWPPARQNLEVAHQGAGRPWVTLSSQAAIPLRAPIAAGYRITREVSAIEQRHPGRWSRGDVLRVRLEVDAQADMGWVALLDPIPAGATLLGSALGGDSALLAADEKRPTGVAPDHQERTHDSFRAYYRFVPKGRFSVEYTLRLNNEGRFQMPPARVEAMYAPERFGETPIEAVEVGP